MNSLSILVALIAFISKKEVPLNHKLKTSIYHLLLFIKNIDLHSNGVAGISFPANGLNLISDNGRAFGITENSLLNVEKSALNANSYVPVHERPYPGWFIFYFNSPAVDIPSGFHSEYTGDFTIYIKDINRKAIVLGCLEGESDAQPTMAPSLIGDGSSGSWYLKNLSKTRFAIACATKYGRTNFCISTPRNGSEPILLNCNLNDPSQRFLGIQVKSL
jgi:hypothetical protein